ncbi:hypothetical protein O3G_MSEX013663 [Manduca sexta]|uniref:Protein lifeguard 1 n=1 Tax=Manduca sexta TaxID=7130 RepID=A0A921ZSR6_MANSE|nr:hypothetical protein O3G_MSEX013663 [Manduca sexta]
MNVTKLNITKRIEDIERGNDAADKGDAEDNISKIDIESIESDAFKTFKDEGEGRNQTAIELVDINEARNNKHCKGNVTGERPANINVIWVQYQVGGRRQIPEGGGAPLNYDPRTRNQFVKVVFILVFLMLCCTAAFTMIVFNSPQLKETFLEKGFLFAICAMVLLVGLNYSMVCSPCTRQMPCNLICLLLAVVGMSLICAFITVRYDTRIVFYAVVATGVVVFVCILLACSKFDFTQWMLYVIVISVAFCVIATIASLSLSLAHLIILLIGTIINVVFITIELQTILGGRAIELSEDDYALGAYLLYTSIMDVFLKMVQIMGIIDD